MKVIYFCVCFFSFLAILYATELEKSGSLEIEKVITLLEKAKNFLSKAEDSYHSCNHDLNSTNESKFRGKKPLAYIQISKKLISEIKENFPTCPCFFPRDCNDILQRGHNESGVYTIRPSETFRTAGKPLLVFCDMETTGGGWVVIQRRDKFKVQQNFYQDWESYKNGFGNILEEFWLGNENIRILCYNGCELRVELKDKDGITTSGNYYNFKLTGKDYTLSYGGYTGWDGVCLEYNNNYPFQTKDNDEAGRAKRYHGGWWYTDDLKCSLNGIYQPDRFSLDGIIWLTFRKNETLSSVSMKIRPFLCHY